MNFSNIQKKLINPNAASHLATLFYLEIIFIMYVLSLLHGKTASLVCGTILSLILTILILSLNSGKNTARKSLLFFLDIHLAYIIVFAFNLFYSGNISGITENIMAHFRLIYIPIDIILLLILSNEKVISIFQKY